MNLRIIEDLACGGQARDRADVSTKTPLRLDDGEETNYREG
jgi:hypothetical protein